MIRARRTPGAVLAALAAATLLSSLGWAITAAAEAHPPHARTAAVHIRPSALPGRSAISLGFVDRDLFQLASGPLRAAWLDRAHALGSSFVRIVAYWSDIAPSTEPPGFNPSNPADPSYDWSTVDSAVRAATAAGETVVVIVASAPTWAEPQPIPAGVRAGTWEPNAADYGAFATAIALRYSGHFGSPQPGGFLPRVSYFQAWNEPNLDRYLMPQWSQDTTTGAFVATSPVIYRSMLNAFYSGVKSVVPSDTVIAAGLAPYGDPPPPTGRGARIAPVTFFETMLCLDPGLRPTGSCANPAHFDAFDHHPYGSTPTIKAHNPDDVAVPDLGKLWRILRAAQHFNLVLPAGPKSLWVTELDWTDVPPSPPSRASLARQARFLPLGFYELWRQGVSHIFWFQLRDPTGQPNSFAGGGLYFLSGAAKPSAAAFRFPFIAIPAQHQKLTIWGLAPRPGRVLIEKRVGRRWRAVLSLTSTPGGLFYANHRLGSHLQLRAVAGTAVSPVWATSGPM